MKGISTIIATLLMLVITIGLAGMAYMYIGGMFGRTTLTISLVDSYCADGTASWTVRNDGTTNISSSSLQIISINEACNNDPTLTEIPMGRTSTLTASNCDRGRTHVYRLVGPSNSIELSVYCP